MDAGVAGLSDDELVGVLRASRRLAAWQNGVELAALAELEAGSVHLTMPAAGWLGLADARSPGSVRWTPGPAGISPPGSPRPGPRPGGT